MATFRVGQRVRIVYALRCPEHIGKEATIVMFGKWQKGSESKIGPRLRDCNVAINCDGENWVTHTDAIEPIQPERNKVIAWAECLWQPEHLRERVS